MFEALERWLRLSAERIHDQADALTALDRAIGDGDHGTQPRPRLRGDRRPARRRAPRRRRRSRPRRGRPSDRRPDADQHGRRGRRAAVRHGVHAGRRRDRGRRGRPAARADPADRTRGGHRRDRRARQGDPRREDHARCTRPGAHGGAWPLSMPGGPSARSSAPMADAAEAGAVATIPLLATKGRASYLGERSIGHQDPGATSSALLLRALADTVTAG